MKCDVIASGIVAAAKEVCLSSRADMKTES